MKSITKRRLKTRSIGRNTLHKRRHSNRRWGAGQNKSRKKRMIGGQPPAPPAPPARAGPNIFTRLRRRGRIQPESAPQSPPPPPPSTGWDCDCKKSDKPPTQTSTKQRSRANIGIKRDNITFTSEGIKLKKKMINNTLPQELHDVVIANVDGSILANEFIKAKDDNERWKILETLINRPEAEIGRLTKLKKIVQDATGGYSSKPKYENVFIRIMPESLWKNNWREKKEMDKIQFIHKAEQQNNTNLLRDIGLFELHNTTKEPDLVVMDAIKGVLDDKGIDLKAEAEAEVDTTTTQVICDCSKKTSMPSEQPLAATNPADVSVELNEGRDLGTFDV